MNSITSTFELQLDEKPQGFVIRLNDEKSCILRICGIPRELVYDEKGEMREFIDITYPK